MKGNNDYIYGSLPDTEEILAYKQNIYDFYHKFDDENICSIANNIAKYLCKA